MTRAEESARALFTVNHVQRDCGTMAEIRLGGVSLDYHAIESPARAEEAMRTLAAPIARAIEAAVREEREACARIIDRDARGAREVGDQCAEHAAATLAEMIRARAALPAPGAEPPGLYRKFIVERADGSSRHGGKHERCDYLVLDWTHDPFAVPAGLAYATACEATHPDLARDVRARAAATGHVPAPAAEPGRDAERIAIPNTQVLHDIAMKHSRKIQSTPELGGSVVDARAAARKGGAT